MEVKEMESTYDTFRKAVENVQKPCAFLDLEALTNNADKIIQKAGDKNVRIASKSIRSVDVLKKLFSMSDQFQGIMNFTAEEALFLYEQGFDDLLRSEEHTSELQSRGHLVCRLLLEKKTTHSC